MLPDELARVDALLDDAAFFAPFVPYFDPRIRRPCADGDLFAGSCLLNVADSIRDTVPRSWSFDFLATVLPNPVWYAGPPSTTLMNSPGGAAMPWWPGSTTRTGRAAEHKLLRTDKVRTNTTVVETAVAYPTDSGLLAKAVGGIRTTVARIQAAGGATRTRVRDRSRSAGQRARSIAAKLRLRGAAAREEGQAAVLRMLTGELAVANRLFVMPTRCCATPAVPCAPRPAGAAGQCTERSMTLIRCCGAWSVAQTRSRLARVIYEIQLPGWSLPRRRCPSKGRLGKPGGVRLQSPLQLITPTG